MAGDGTLLKNWMRARRVSNSFGMTILINRNRIRTTAFRRPDPTHEIEPIFVRTPAEMVIPYEIGGEIMNQSEREESNSAIRLLESMIKAEQFNQNESPTIQEHVEGILNLFELFANLAYAARDLDENLKRNGWVAN
jgi:hypothetical protein